MKHKKHKVNPLRHDIEFRTEDILHITLETERLSINSITHEDEKNCIELLADPVVMEKFATGVTYEGKETKELLTKWATRWKRHDPFSVYTLVEKKSGEFIGIIAISHSSPGESDISYAIHHKFWGQGYGSETADAVFQSLIPRLMLRGYKLEHVPLRKLVATARLDNPASQQILKGVGFKEEEKVHRFGAWRQSYGIFAKQVRNEYHHFFDKKDRLDQRKAYLSSVDDGVDVTVAEMAASSFGQSCQK
jgi:ribosomal-protein-alanine N-acetyltransferase